MGKIKKILENELIGGTQSTDVYPITSTKAVYDSSNKSLEDILKSLVENNVYAGVATPSTNPGTPDGNVFYFATQAGTYTNFGSVELNAGLNILHWNGTSWVATNVMNIAQDLGTSEEAVISQKSVSENIHDLRGFEVIKGVYTPSRYINDNMIISVAGLEVNGVCIQVLQETFKGGKIEYYTYTTGSNNEYRLVFYDDNDEPISGVHCNNAETGYYDLVDIPTNAAYCAIFAKIDDIDNHPHKLYAPIQDGSLNIYNNMLRIGRGLQDYMEPLGDMDNYLQDCFLTSYNGALIIDNTYMKNNGELYGLRINNGLRLNGTVKRNTIACLKIKKTGDENRIIEIIGDSGGYVHIKENAPVKDVYYQDISLITKVIRNDKDYIWLFFYRSTSDEGLRVIVYKNSSRSEYDKLEFDENRSFIIYTDKYTYDNYDEINFDKKYYRRYEKLGSRIAGKTAIVFADSLSYFNDALVYDYGLNIYTISEGGGRMSYAGQLNTWIVNDNFIQSFKEQNVTNVDFILFATGANDPEMEDTDADNVKYVLNNKRWFDSSAATDPWSSLEEGNKLKFTSAACMYAAAYSLCKLYQGACVAVVTPYRTPGVSTTTWDVNAYAEALFNGRFTNCWETLRSISDRLGAIYIENWTRDNTASAEAYHDADGTHPSFVIAEDMAVNIGSALSNICDTIYKE